MATETLPQILRDQAAKYGHRKIAMRKKEFGIWRGYTWQEVYDHVKWVALGLVSLGFKPGDHAAIVGDNDPQWFWAEYAAQACGGAATGLYVDAHYGEVQYLVDHSDSRFVFAKDQEQVDKVLQVRAQLPKVERIFYWEDKGLWYYDDPLLMSYEELEKRGKEYEQSHPGLLDEMLARGKGADVAALCYTSGTTGTVQKGVMMTHRQLVHNCEVWFQQDPWYDTDVYLTYVPPAWAMEQVQGIAGALMAGVEICFPEEPETVQNDLREISPQYVFFGARVWDSLASDIQARINDSTRAKRWLYQRFLHFGYRMADDRFKGKKSGVWRRGLWWLGNLLVYRPLRDKVGLLRVRSAYQAGATLSPDCFHFFHSIGVNLKQLYGLTESGIISIHLDRAIDPESVGVLLEPENTRVGERSEVLCRTSRMSLGYYKNPEATRELVDQEGWLHTGDSGYITEAGHLVLYGRVRDVEVLPSGHPFAPEYIESKLGFSPYIRYAWVIGGADRPFVSAVVCIDYQNVGDWAEGHRIPYTTYVDLSQKPQVYDLIQKDIERVNRYLPEPVRIKRFLNFHKEFDPDEAELTRTRKLKRRVMLERYQGLVDCIYGGGTTYDVEAEVKYRDGRTGVIRTTISVRDVATG